MLREMVQNDVKIDKSRHHSSIPSFCLWLCRGGGYTMTKAMVVLDILLCLSDVKSTEQRDVKLTEKQTCAIR